MQFQEKSPAFGMIIERVRTDAIEFERRQIHFFGDVFTAVVVFVVVAKKVSIGAMRRAPSRVLNRLFRHDSGARKEGPLEFSYIRRFSISAGTIFWNRFSRYFAFSDRFRRYFVKFQ